MNDDRLRLACQAVQSILYPWAAQPNQEMVVSEDSINRLEEIDSLLNDDFSLKLEEAKFQNRNVVPSETFTTHPNETAASRSHKVINSAMRDYESLCIIIGTGMPEAIKQKYAWVEHSEKDNEKPRMRLCLTESLTFSEKFFVESLARQSATTLSGMIFKWVNAHTYKVGGLEMGLPWIPKRGRDEIIKECYGEEWLAVVKHFWGKRDNKLGHINQEVWNTVNINGRYEPYHDWYKDWGPFVFLLVKSLQICDEENNQDKPAKLSPKSYDPGFLRPALALPYAFSFLSYRRVEGIHNPENC